MTKILICGAGNLLRGDDAVGIHALRELESRIGSRPGIRLYESGIAGLGVVQELLDGYDALIILDALDRGSAPGSVFVLEPLQSAGLPDPVDLHQADPEKILKMASAMGALPPRVFIVGCQMADCEELTQELSAAVRRAVPQMVQEVLTLVERIAPGGNGRDEAGPLRELSAVDEILQVMYWLRGEGIAPDASAEGLSRWLALDAEAIRGVLGRMEKLGLVEVGSARYRLTDDGAREGGRRFADEFSELTRAGHGECGDVDCECQRTGNPADCRHQSS